MCWSHKLPLSFSFNQHYWEQEHLFQHPKTGSRQVSVNHLQHNEYSESRSVHETVPKISVANDTRQTFLFLELIITYAILAYWHTSRYTLTVSLWTNRALEFCKSFIPKQSSYAVPAPLHYHLPLVHESPVLNLKFPLSMLLSLQMARHSL